MRSSFSMPLLYHAYVYLEFLILACTIYILAPYETYNFSGGFRFYDAVANDHALIERSYACGMDY